MLNTRAGNLLPASNGHSPGCLCPVGVTHERSRCCRSGIVYFGLGLAKTKTGHATVGALLRLVENLNAHTRFCAADAHSWQRNWRRSPELPPDHRTTWRRVSPGRRCTRRGRVPSFDVGVGYSFFAAHRGQSGRRLNGEFRSAAACSGAKFTPDPSTAGCFRPDSHEIYVFSNIGTVEHGDFAAYPAAGPAPWTMAAPDLVIIGRSLSSSAYDNGDADGYNSMTIPMISFTSYVSRAY